MWEELPQILNVNKDYDNYPKDILKRIPTMLLEGFKRVSRMNYTLTSLFQFQWENYFKTWKIREEGRSDKFLYNSPGEIFL